MAAALCRQEICRTIQKMRAKKIILSLLLGVMLVLVLPNIASAYSTINIYLDQTGEAVFIGTTTDNITNSSLPDGVEVNNYKISGITNTLTSKQGDNWTFQYSLKYSTLNLILPNSIKITSNSNGDIEVSDRDVIVSSKDYLNITYSFTSQSQDSSPITIIVFLIIAIAALISLIVFFNVRMSKKNKRKLNINNKNNKISNLEIIEKVLNEREKIILSNLKKTGKIKMSYLRKLSNIPKASFSRHLQELEKKGLVRRFGEGKNKLVELVGK